MRISLDTIVTEAGITDQSGKGKGESECLACGRNMTEEKAEHAPHLHMSVYREILPMAEDAADDSQGCFPVGASCAAKLRKALKARGLDPRSYLG